LGLKQFNAEQVKDCEGDQALNGPCAFYPYRLGKRPTVKVFRAFCLDCMCGYSESVKECTVEKCECYPYRQGKNPALTGKRKASEAGIEALKNYRNSSRDDTDNALQWFE